MSLTVERYWPASRYWALLASERYWQEWSVGQSALRCEGAGSFHPPILCTYLHLCLSACLPTWIPCLPVCLPASQAKNLQHRPQRLLQNVQDETGPIDWLLCKPYICLERLHIVKRDRTMRSEQRARKCGSDGDAICHMRLHPCSHMSKYPAQMTVSLL
jgi:hypothetical protein